MTAATTIMLEMMNARNAKNGDMTQNPALLKTRLRLPPIVIASRIPYMEKWTRVALSKTFSMVRTKTFDHSAEK